MYTLYWAGCLVDWLIDFMLCLLDWFHCLFSWLIERLVCCCCCFLVVFILRQKIEPWISWKFQQPFFIDLWNWKSARNFWMHRISSLLPTVGPLRTKVLGLLWCVECSVILVLLFDCSFVCPPVAYPRCSSGDSEKGNGMGQLFDSMIFPLKA